MWPERERENRKNSLVCLGPSRRQMRTCDDLLMCNCYERLSSQWSLCSVCVPDLWLRCNRGDIMSVNYANKMASCHSQPCTTDIRTLPHQQAQLSFPAVWWYLPEAEMHHSVPLGEQMAGWEGRGRFPQEREDRSLSLSRKWDSSSSLCLMSL